MAKHHLHQCISLKPSRIALGFQVLCLVIILIFTFFILDIALWLVFAIVGVMSFFWLCPQSSVSQLEQLEFDRWSIKLNAQTQIESVQITQFVDHILYIVVYFQDKKHLPLIIWKDQVSVNQWKSLKIRCKFS